MNLHKSRMYGVGSVDQIDILAECLGCLVGHLPNTYLRLPLGAPYKSFASWNPVVSHIQKMLAGWKGSLLSKGGKVVLIKFVLTSLLTYYLSLFSIPVTVEKNIEQC